ncbi:hydantoinase B/oxoprolinase family protein [Paracoccus sp. P2]|uniref:Hydantoinase B/oxoprolinase family protein n=1 Tax=Paracoccus pantotrophus TaxID=82367 RepID=A0A7H9C004_PARPN|nr:hydantoinase B/oxoprolinase family protein [Paracoccus pantotrophus]MDF3855195.1 hydantoinase B/oxoprolinase family protein [Paracoccus pantotrophus]QLH16947.1 hydantoinase B/oxoprolinase family protein [Paracoccus pantotrophus]RDD97952.1 methylhydantoinase [Paracoccus pantotrophus]RNI14336.1 methylhydantoinase [Paracoccus pantotrophus]WGR65890.1 methylhydantoinase [Paracoccus pantotrophus]
MSQHSDIDIDPITFEVMRSIFEFASDRMATVLQRSSFSPILADMLDFSNAIYDADLQLLSQAANCPVHLAAMKFSAEEAVKGVGPQNVHEGDVLVLNDPYRGGTHINDITFTKPIFYKGQLIGYGVSRGHWMDLGGGGAGGQAFSTHIAAEGLRLPPLKIYSGGKLNEDLLAIILNNSRTPHFIKGDVQAHLGALLAAEQELQRACDRYGVDTVRAAMKKIQAYTEKMVRGSIRTIPNGVYEAEDYADTDGITQSRVKVKVRLEIGDDSIKVDFTGTDPICQGAINSPKANTMSAALYSLQFFLAPDAPQNQGLFNPIEVILPEGCWLNATWPAPTIGCTTLTASKITSAIWQALAKAIPERVTGSTCADANWFVASCVDDQGRADVFSDLPAGGWGGTPYSDGMNVTMDPLGNCMNMAAETAELFFPIAYEAFELRQDSAGAGRYRGGLGSVFKVRFFGGGELGMETSRTLSGSPGAAGGLTSAVQRSSHIRADGTTEVIGGIDDDGNWHNPLLASHKFGPGETFMFESTGGGGWGDPRQRAVQDVLEDVLDEYVSINAAKELYGVVIDPTTLTVDEAATAALRG